MTLISTLQTAVLRLWLWFKERVQNRRAEPWLWVLSFLEGFLPLIPVDPFLAAMVLADRARWLWLATIATAASTIGALVGYGIGLFAFDALGAWFIEFSDRSAFVEKMTLLFTDNAEAIVFAAALTPIPNAPVVIAAGFLGSNLFWFVVAWTIGRVLRFFGVAYIVYAFGLSTLSRAERTLTVGTIVLVLVIVSVLAYNASGASAL
jgi:membrane protein YqaA with SNARE-associated domain